MKNATANAMFLPPLIDAIEKETRGAQSRAIWARVGGLIAAELPWARKAARDDTHENIWTMGPRNLCCGAQDDQWCALLRQKQEDISFTNAVASAAKKHDKAVGALIRLLMTCAADERDEGKPLHDAQKSLLRLATYGFPEIRVFPDLCDSLARTHLRAPTRALALPYPAIEILLPRQTANLFFLTQRQLAAKSIIVRVVDLIPSHKLCLDVMAFASSDRSELAFDNCERYRVDLAKLMLCGTIITDDTVHKAAIPSLLRDEITSSKFMLFALNVLLYINSERADVRQRAPGAKPFPAPGREHELRERQYDVGRRIVIPGCAAARGEGGGTGAKITTFHWVRGHWHNYLVGQGRQETKLKWVQPYTKGGVVRPERRREYEATMPPDEPTEGA